jgi:1-pyrroline-5-carboxylate dehydrogenase
MEKITYASLASLGEDFHKAFDAGLIHERKRLGLTHPCVIGGRKVTSSGGAFTVANPADTRVLLGKFQRGTRAQVAQAASVARKAAPLWRELGWPQRLSFLRKAADLMTKHQFELAALLSLEVGKNRYEAIAEVSEAIDLILYYCQQMEQHAGFERRLGGTGAEETRSVLRPYGVWAVISPFNFPFALATGMASAALIGGNTVVFKPASATPLSGLRLSDLLHQAGLPVGVFNCVTGSGDALAAEFMTHREFDGLAFTGSREVGMKLLAGFTHDFPRPCIVEMGGKNPALIMPTAHLEDAAEGVMRSAFGMGGQKCSACSRVFVHRQIYKPFLDLLVEKTKARKIGPPTDRDTFLGPLINEAAVKKFKRAVDLGRRQGRVVRGGGAVEGDAMAHGHFVDPAIVDQLPATSALFEEEFFAPVLAVAEVRSLAEAIERANQSAYGLTAGIFTQLEEERLEFFERIEAGVAYCNRRGGATTGAWPGVQSFGGWKGSGSTGKNALGPYYIQQFMREQSHTHVTR